MAGGMIFLHDLINRIEKGMVRFVVLCLLGLVLVQGLMTSEPIRFFLSWGERMEGQPIEIPASQSNQAALPEEIKSPQAAVTLKIDKFSALPKAKVLVNGQERARFDENKTTVSLQASDTLEIDSTAYNFPIDYEIASTSSTLEFPSPGQKYTANQAVVMVGKIIVK